MEPAIAWRTAERWFLSTSHLASIKATDTINHLSYSQANNIDNMQINCADCGCLPEECKSSKSTSECSNCSRKLEGEGCCCWASNNADSQCQ